MFGKNIWRYLEVLWTFVSVTVKWGHSQLPCFLLGLQCDHIYESILFLSKPYANKYVYGYIQPNSLESRKMCTCVSVCVSRSSRYRTGPYMTHFALLNSECNLILRLLAKKRILPPPTLKTVLKMDGPPGTPRHVSTVRVQAA